MLSELSERLASCVSILEVICLDVIDKILIDRLGPMALFVINSAISGLESCFVGLSKRDIRLFGCNITLHHS